MNEDREKQMDVEATDANEEPVEQEEMRAEQKRVERTPPAAAQPASNPKVLFAEEDAKKFRSRWLAIQSKFVDDPRASVKQADDLVADVIKSITMNFSDRRVGLEKQWNSGENISTEDLRVAVQQYRSFFDGLLNLGS